MRPLTSFAVGAIVALLAMHGLCVAQDTGIRVLPENENVPVTFECVAKTGVEQTVAVLRTLEGVEVTGWFATMISLRMTLLRRQQLEEVLQTKCSNIFRSFLGFRPTELDQETRVVTPPTIDTKEALRAMQLEGFLANHPGLDGAGVKIGILSDSFNNLGATSFPCQAVQDLTVVRENPIPPPPGRPGTDEGRGMAELICFIAPKAQLFFNTANGGLAAFASGIVALKDRGCNIIVDDIYYANEAWYSPGILAQAVEQVKAAGVAYFSSANNYAGQSWEGSARWDSLGALGVAPPPAGAQSWHDWGTPGVTKTGWLSVQVTDSLGLQWDEPFRSDTNGAASATSDLDLYLCASIPTTSAGYAFPNCLSSTNNNVAPSPTGTGNPVEFMGGPGVIAAGTYFVGVALKSQAPARGDLRFKLYSSRFFDVVPGQNGQTSGAAMTSPHTNTASGVSVGAADFRQTPGFGQSPAILEDFSSWGVQPIFYTAAGQRLAKPTVLLKPDLVGPDGTATTFFGRLENGVRRFFGTSAAAPNVAAVGALILQQGRLLPEALFNKMRASARDMFLPNTVGPANDQPTAGPDRYTGFGFLNGGAALTQCTQGLCCRNGVFATAGTPCRPAAHPCDVAEVCTGNSGDCPIDAKKADGSHCPWYGTHHPLYGEFMAEQSTPALTYHEADATTLAETTSAYSSCKGTCQSGICTITPHDAYCCFTDAYEADAYEANAAAEYASGHHRSKHHSGQTGKKNGNKKNGDKKYVEHKYEETPYKDKKYDDSTYDDKKYDDDKHVGKNKGDKKKEKYDDDKYDEDKYYDRDEEETEYKEKQRRMHCWQQKY